MGQNRRMRPLRRIALGVAVSVLVVLETEDQRLALKPFTYCWGGPGLWGCADGMLPHPLPDLGSTDLPIRMMAPLDGWSLRASFEPIDPGAGRGESVVAEPVGDGAWIIPLVGPPATYRVFLHGRGRYGEVNMVFTVTAGGAGVEGLRSKHAN